MSARRLWSALVVALVALLVVAGPASADPSPPPTTAATSPSSSPSSDPCTLIHGDAHKYCQRGQEQKNKAEQCKDVKGTAKEHCMSSFGDSFTNPTSSMDPLSSLADGIAEAAAWVVTQLSNAVTATATVDFTNPKFLQTYAIVFAAATFLVLLIWLWAVIKRVVRGVPAPRAFGEAIGLLWLTVLASAFTPLILYTVVTAVDGITDAIAGGSANPAFFQSFSDALTKSAEGGPMVKILLSAVSILAAGVIWFELVIREALLYVGAALGTVVYSGLIDKDLWGRVRKWAGIMSAIILVKPIVAIVLRLASALTQGGPSSGVGAIVSGLSIIMISIIASAMLFRLIPGMGDEIVAARRDSYDPASRQATAVVTRPVTGITQGINTHAARDSASRAPAASSPTSASPSVGASSGIAAHSTRPSSPRPPRQDVPVQDHRGDSTR
nr:integral membrane protein [Streptomyces sp. PsTaAH-124]